MNGIAIYLGDRAIQWSSVIISMGALCCLTLTIALYRQRAENSRAVLALFPLSFVLGLFLARLLYWYFDNITYDAFSSFGSAFSDFSKGSFALPGVILGIWLAAWLVYRMGMVPNTGMLLDCAAPGVALLIAFVRLSAYFNGTCGSRIPVEAPLLKTLPFAVSQTDAAGNTNWSLATFFLAFLVMLGVTWALLRFYCKFSRRKMLAPCSAGGNVWRMFLLYYGAVELVVDSLRTGRLLMHFRLISGMNQYFAFVGFAQIFAAATMLYVLLYYTVNSIKARGFSLLHALSWLGFVLCLVGVGYLGQYKVERYSQYLKSYSIMIVSCILLVVIIRLAYSSCVFRKKSKYEW